MKKLFFTSLIIISFLLISLIIILATIGFETDKFNNVISEKAEENNKNISLKLEKVKFKFDIKDLNLFVETTNPKLRYKNLLIPISKAKVYLDFSNLIKSNIKIEKVNLSSEEISIEQLKKIIIKTKPSNLNSLIINKIKNGKLITNLELYLKDNFEIDNFIIKGEVKNMNAIISDNFSLTNTSFSFFGDISDILIKDVNSKMDGLIIKDGNFQIKNDKEINIKSDFITKIDINQGNINNYLSILKKVEFINDGIKIKGEINNFFDVTFDKTLKITNYIYSNKGEIDKSYFKLNKTIGSSFLEKNIDNLYLKNSDFVTRYALDKKNYINIEGQYSIDEKKYQGYTLKNNFLKDVSKTILDFEISEKLNIDFINYQKDEGKTAKIYIDFSRKKNLLDLKDFKYSENKNFISIKNLKLDKKELVSVKKIKVQTFKKNDLKNDFTLDFEKDKNFG